MNHHDAYGKRLMGVVAGDAFVPNRKINYGGILSDGDIKPKIDGVVGETLAVEIQAGWSKPARAAILDLICSDEYPSKLLLVIGPPNSGGYGGPRHNFYTKARGFFFALSLQSWERVGVRDLAAP
ncbi:MAG: hypothetical protein WA005_05020, partial [Candidatus Binataceae bacterium]